jgi:iron complex outermembrane recepter protein
LFHQIENFNNKKKIAMKQQLLTLAIFLLLGIGAAAQQQAVVRGTVQDQKGNGLPAVSIALLNAKDSALVKAAISGENGHYEIATTGSGNFLLSFSAVGFETNYSKPFGLEAGQTIEVPSASLQNQSKQLAGVTVTASKPLVQVKADRTIFNVQNSINATGSTALEILQKTPGVQVDDKENISVKGKKGVRIYVDGRMSQLTSEDLAAYLKSINSNDIEAIEIISNPGSKYDASGNAGIINIRLKKNSSKGANGSITAGFIQGITPKANAAANFNYRNKKVNVFANAGVNIGKYQYTPGGERIQKDTQYVQNLTLTQGNTNYNLKAGADYFINNQQTIGIIATAGVANSDWNSASGADIYYHPTGEYVKTLVALNDAPRKRTNFNTNLNYRYADTNGVEINLDADYGFFRGRSVSTQPNFYTDKEGKLLSQVITSNSTPTDINIYSAKVDFVVPVAKGKLGFGGKFAHVETDNTSDFYINSDNSSVKANDRSFDFVYTELVSAAYVTYQRPLGEKLSLNAGVRVEHTNSESKLNRHDGLVQSDNNVMRDYVDFFPNAALTFNLNKSNTFNLSYSRRIDRPVYQDLNPFELKIDELTYLKGNSFLRPQYTDNVELSHTWNNTITTSIGYSHVKDYATYATDTLNNATFLTSRNLASQDIINASVSAPFTIQSWWRGFATVWFNYQVFDGEISNSKVDEQATAYGAFLQQSFTIGHGYTAELSGYFNGPSRFGPTWKVKSMGGVDAGIQKTVLNNNGTVRISATDIFHTANRWRASNNFGGLIANVNLGMETQTVRVSFTYRLGNNILKASRERKTGLEAEAKRIKTD